MVPGKRGHLQCTSCPKWFLSSVSSVKRHRKLYFCCRSTVVKVTLKMLLSVYWFHLFWSISFSFPDLWCWWCCVHKNLCKRVKTSIYLSPGMKWRAVESPSRMSIRVCCYWCGVVCDRVCSIWICILLSVFYFIFHHRCYSFLTFMRSFFCVCFVFCSCHLQWFYQWLNLLGITHSCFGVFLIANSAVLWLGLKRFFTSAEVSVEFQCCWPDFCKLQVAFSNPDACFFPSSDLSLCKGHPGTSPVSTGAVMWQNETRPGELFALSSCISEGRSRRETVFTLNWQRFAFLVEILANQVQSTAVFTGQIMLWSKLLLTVITPKRIRPDQRARRIW